jgi:hypothetical protein
MGLGDASLLAGVNPVTAAISAGVGLANTALSSWLSDKRIDGQQKIEATNIVNELERQIQSIDNAFFAGPMTCADQAATLAGFDSAMAWLASQAGCAQLALGAAGQACINDRERGGKLDWYSLYRDPVSNATCTDPADTSVSTGTAVAVGSVPAPVGTSAVSSIFTSVFFGLPLWGWLLGGLLLVFLL